MKTFVTGATGLVGSHLVKKLLAQGEHVVAIKRTNSSTALLDDVADKIEWRNADVLDVDALDDAMQGCEYVYHVAAFISYYRPEFEKMMKINVEGTANVVNTALRQGVKKMIHVSSIAALTHVEKVELIDENGEWQENKYTSNYGKSKHLAEMEVYRGIAEGLNAAIINPSIILGYGNWQSGSSSIFQRIKKGEPMYPPGASGFVDVEDVVDAMIALMKSDVSNEKFIVSGHNLSFKDIFDKIADRLSATKPKLTASSWMISLYVIIEGLVSFLLRKPALVTRESALSLVDRKKYDNSKIKNQLGFEFRELDKSLDRICALYQKK